MLITSEAEAEAALLHVKQGSAPIVADTETDGVDWWKSKVCGWVLGRLDDEKQFYFPVRHKEGWNLPESWSRRIASEVLVPEREQNGHHYSFDMKVAAKEGLRLPHKIFDTMLVAHLMNENEDSFKMEHLAALYLDPSYANAEAGLIEYLCERFKCHHKRAKQHLHEVSAEQVWQYACQDIATTRELRRFYEPHLKTWKLRDLADEVFDFQLLLTEMEMRGILVDADALKKLGEDANPKALELEHKIQAMARTDLSDPEFPGNPRSHPQMKMWLGKMLGVPNTSKDTLKVFDDVRPKTLLEYRIWQKLKSSFVDPYWGLMDDINRIHPGLWICSPGTRGDDLHGTSSSRLSSTRPNMQQVPPAARHLFTEDDGWTLVEMDYSQAELRLAAHYYWTRFGDGAMANLLVEGEDLHQATADASGIPRKAAKIRNFAIQYGAGAQRLATMFSSTRAAEARYLKTYHKMFPGCKKLTRQCMRQAEEYGYIRLWTGRTLRFNCPRAASYKAQNRLIQGGIAEMVRIAGVRCRKEVPEAEALLQVHDSYLFRIPTATVDRTIPKLRAIMQDQPWCELPMVVDVKKSGNGGNWADMEELPRDPIGIPAAVMAKVSDVTLLCG